MDDQRLAEQMAKTGNLMDLTYEDDWWEGDNWDGPIEAGVMAKPYVAYLDSLTPEQHRFLRRRMRLFSILLPELQRWLQSWELGCSFEVVYTEARRRIYGHFQQPTVEQTDWIDGLIAEDDQNLPRSERTLRAQVIPMLSSILTQEDRQALADIAAQGMAQGVLQRVQVDTVSPIAV
jgi:hypothetical protein